MKVFYLIQAHTNPEQLKRMINRLTTDQVFFLIHIDLKSEASSFQSVCNQKNVFFIEDRVNCIWGDFSQVQATLNLINNLKQQDILPMDRVVLISGQDYPLVGTKQIEDFYQTNDKTEFIEKFVAKDIHYRPYLNFRGYKVNKSDKRGDYVIFKKHNISGIHKSLLKGCFKFKYLKHIFKQRELDSSIEFYKGSSWWALTYQTITKITDLYYSEYDKFYDFFKVSFCVDEYFFQTLLVEVMKKDKNIETKDILTYIDWNKKNVPLPVTFGMEDTKDLLLARQQGFLYARKFDSLKNECIMDWIDANLLN